MKLDLSKSLASVLIVSSALISSCVDSDKDLFNAEKTKELYQNAFPVKDIDPDMNWKTTQSLNIKVIVNEDWGVDYKVQIFDTNPLDAENNAKLLSEGYANQSTNFITTIDCPKALDMVYVSRIDNKGHYLVKPALINNSTVEVSFGKEQTASKVATRATESIIPVIDAPYDESQIKNMLGKAIELSQKTTNWDKNTANIGNEIDAIYKVTKDLQLTSISAWGKGAKLIIIDNEATLTLSNIQSDKELCLLVLNGIVNITPEKIAYAGGVHFVVYKNGKLIGNEITFSDNSQGYLNYNAGELDLKGLTFSGSSQGTFYNSGKVNIKLDLISSNHGFTLVNKGRIEVKGNLDFGSNAVLQSACGVDVKLNLMCRQLVIGKNSKVECGEFTTGGADNLSIIMEPASMLECEGQATLNRIITGPGRTEDYALIKAKNIKSGQDYTGNSHSKVSGNIYFAIEQQKNNDPGFKEFERMLASSNMNGFLCEEKKAPFIMDEDECTGSGYLPDEGQDNVVVNPIPYTYAFEDNFPSVGDYDFNDIVLNVTTQYDREKDNNKIKSIHYNVTLSAIGASKKLGSGLRLAGINRSDIESVTFAGKTSIRETLTNSMFENNNIESIGNEVVIPLFGDAHQVYGYGDNHVMLNTGQNKTDELYTLEIIIVPTDKNRTEPIITKDNLDFFIAYSMGNQDKRTEIHLYEFRDKGATTNGNIHKNNLDVAGQFTWAICVPNFKYPIEGIKITDAYPNFEKWAKNHTENQDWYKYPANKSDKDYIFEF